MLTLEVEIMKLNEVIKNRVTMTKFLDQEVKVEQVISLLEDSVYAPNHKMREPWRFILIDQKRKEVLKSAFRDQVNVIDPIDEKKFDTIFQAPLVLAVIMKLNQNYTDEIEDLQATAAVIQNFMLLSYEQGIGTAWKTPSFIELDSFKEALGVRVDELIVALVMTGHVNEFNKPKTRISAKNKVTLY